MAAMPKRSSTRRPPADVNEAAARVVRIATGEDPATPAAELDHPPAPPEKNPAAVALGRLGGKKGGVARAAVLSPEQRQEIAQKAARARWGVS